MQLPVREGFLRVISCLPGLFCVYLTPARAHPTLEPWELWGQAWDGLVLIGWGSLFGLLLSRLLYRGSWSSWQPGPPRGFPSCRHVPDTLNTVFALLALVSVLAIVMAGRENSGYYSLLSATLAFLLWYGLQRWEVSTPSGVKIYRTFYGLQWLARDSNPSIHWETTGPVGIRSDEAAFQKRHRWARLLGGTVYIVMVLLLVVSVAGRAGADFTHLLAALYSPLPLYFLSYRVFFWCQPAGVACLLRRTPQPANRENPLLPEARPADRRGCLFLVLAFPPTWLVLLLALSLFCLPVFHLAGMAHLSEGWLCAPWALWLGLKLLQTNPSYIWHEVDLADLAVRRLEVCRGYQFDRSSGPTRILRAVGVTPAAQGISKFVPVLYFAQGDYLMLGDGQDQSWAWEIACKLAQKAMVPAISPRKSVLTAEVSGWIRSRHESRLTEWGALQEVAPEVSDEPPVD